MNANRFAKRDKPLPGWHHEKGLNGSYYTPFCRTQRGFFAPGPGDRYPTPAEMVECMRAHPKGYADDSGLFVTEEDITLPPTGEMVELPGGCYMHAPAGQTIPERLIPTDLRTDGYVKLPGQYGRVSEHVRDFLSAEEHYRAIGAGSGTMYKLGLLLYGPPGEGKTSTIRQVIKDLIPEDSVVIFLDGVPSPAFLEKVRANLADRYKVFVFEELVAVISNHSTRIESVLDFLDGEQSVDKSLTFGTTNYADRLPVNIVDRPGRFDELYKFGHPAGEDLRLILGHYLGSEPTAGDLATVKGLSSAAIRECCLRSKIRNQTLEKSAKQMRARTELVTKEFSEARPIGIYKGIEPDYD